VFEYSILTSSGRQPLGHRKDLTRAKAEARKRSATVTSLIIIITGDDEKILAAYELGDLVPVDKAEFVASHGYRALADTGQQP
jgi:hypothetical protein